MIKSENIGYYNNHDQLSKCYGLGVAPLEGDPPHLLKSVISLFLLFP